MHTKQKPKNVDLIAFLGFSFIKVSAEISLSGQPIFLRHNLLNTNEYFNWQEENNTLIKLLLYIKGETGMDSSVNAEISELRKLMTNTAEKYDFNFQHPEVIEISQKLDTLILIALKRKASSPAWEGCNL